MSARELARDATGWALGDLDAYLSCVSFGLPSVPNQLVAASTPIYSVSLLGWQSASIAALSEANRPTLTVWRVQNNKTVDTGVAGGSVRTPAVAGAFKLTQAVPTGAYSTFASAFASVSVTGIGSYIGDTHFRIYGLEFNGYGEF